MSDAPKHKVNGRNKGAAFEREIANEVFLHLGVKLKRDLEQYRAGDHGDLIADDRDWPWTIECKRYASGTGCKPAWWEQARKAAAATNLHPVVVYKYDRLPIRVVMRASVMAPMMPKHYLIEMGLDTFYYVTREIMATNRELRT
jgi:hypothetical protein